MASLRPTAIRRRRRYYSSSYLCLEPHEDQRMLGVLTVNSELNNNFPGDEFATLREAIIPTNENSVTDLGYAFTYFPKDGEININRLDSEVGNLPDQHEPMPNFEAILDLGTWRTPYTIGGPPELSNHQQDTPIFFSITGNNF
jgi:hypothetical protein